MDRNRRALCPGQVLVEQGDQIRVKSSTCLGDRFFCRRDKGLSLDAVKLMNFGALCNQLLGANPIIFIGELALRQRCLPECMFYAFPDIHWQKIRTNNPLERIMREIRRRTRVVGAFPDGQSCLNLAAARLRFIAGSAWSTKRYMNMRPLYQLQDMQTGAVA